MAQVSYSRKALADLERLTDFLRDTDEQAAARTAALIVEAVSILRNHPLIGRAAESRLRELVVSRGRSGYIVLYSVDPVRDVVKILSVRHQRESGFRPLS